MTIMRTKTCLRSNLLSRVPAHAYADPKFNRNHPSKSRFDQSTIGDVVEGLLYDQSAENDEKNDDEND